MFKRVNLKLTNVVQRDRPWSSECLALTFITTHSLQSPLKSLKPQLWTSSSSTSSWWQKARNIIPSPGPFRIFMSCPALPGCSAPSCEFNSTSPPQLLKSILFCCSSAARRHNRVTHLPLLILLVQWCYLCVYEAAVMVQRQQGVEGLFPTYLPIDSRMTSLKPPPSEPLDFSSSF